MLSDLYLLKAFFSKEIAVDLYPFLLIFAYPISRRSFEFCQYHLSLEIVFPIISSHLLEQMARVGAK